VIDLGTMLNYKAFVSYLRQ